MTDAVFVVGAGPGIGAAVARRFGREGFSVGLLARRRATLDTVMDTLGASAATSAAVEADCADQDSLVSGLVNLTDRLGTPRVVVYNAALIRPDTVDELDLPTLLSSWAVDVGGAVVTAGRLIPEMIARHGGGTFLITSGMPEPVWRYATLSLGKAGVRTLTDVLDQQFGASGMHAASVTVTDAVSPGTAHDPEAIADHYWKLHLEPRGSWRREVVH